MNEKINKFLEGYKRLVDEHNVDFITIPMFIPDGQGGFRIVVQSQAIDKDDLRVEAKDFIQKK